MALFNNDRSTIQTMFSMEQRITTLERKHEVSRDCQATSLDIAFSVNRELREELRALYDYRGVEPTSLSGITFVRKGKD